jgi:hypothetical protein
MSVTWQESSESPKLSGKSLERHYLGWGTSDPDTARYELLLQSPTIDGYLLRKDAEVEPHDDSDTIWKGTVTYEPANQSQGGGLLPPTFRFSTSGGKTKIMSSYQVVGAYGEGAAAGDYGLLIGVKDDGSVEGVEVEVPGFSWQETWRFTPQQLTWTYAKKVRDLSATTNRAVFRGFSPGEVLFLYADGGSQGQNEDYREVTFHFASHPNETGLVVGDIAGIAKKGWEYLDIKYETAVIGEGATQRKVQRPVRVYVHRVFREGNHNWLGIGS